MLLRTALGDHLPPNIRELRVQTGGPREYVIEAFFRADPDDLKKVLNAPPFRPDERGAEVLRHGDTRFIELSNLLMPGTLLSYSRSDFASSSNKCCYVITDDRYSFAYVYYVETEPPPKK